MDTPRATISNLPPELFLSIFSYLPSRTIKTVISPLVSITRSSPSKSALQNLSLTSKFTRVACLPYIFESIAIKSLAQFEDFTALDGVGENFGIYIRRMVIRWESYGEVVKATAQSSNHVETVKVLMKKAVNLMPGLQSLTIDFPGAIDALAFAFEGEDVSERLQVVNARNGKWEYSGNIAKLLRELGKLRGLQSVAIDGTACATSFTEPTRAIQLRRGDFAALISLEIGNVTTFDDHILREIMRLAGQSTALTVKNCPGITLSSTRHLLLEHGKRFQYLSLEILKKWIQEEHRPDDEPEHGHELYRFSEDEHLCPVIRDHCTNLRILNLYTNKICKEILFLASSKSGAMTGGLPTPPGSPNLPLTRVADIPTQHTVVPTEEHKVAGSTVLPASLFSFQNLSLFHRGEEERLAPATAQERQKMKKASLRIPYDFSCYGSGMGGPSLQQRFTTLCDGSPAKDLLEIGKRAFDEGLVELANIQGHWKGGPRLIMAD